MLINKINREENGRGMSETDLPTVSVGDIIYGQAFKDMITRNATISAHHCYCEADGDIETHSGCGAYSYSPTATASNHDVGAIIYASGINQIEADIDGLIAECDCDAHTCTCEANAPYSCTNVSHCTCNFYCPAYCNPNWKILECACYANIVRCSCNTACQCNIDCTCDEVCSCEYN